MALRKNQKDVHMKSPEEKLSTWLYTLCGKRGRLLAAFAANRCPNPDRMLDRIEDLSHVIYEMKGELFAMLNQKA